MCVQFIVASQQLRWEMNIAKEVGIRDHSDRPTLNSTSNFIYWKIARKSGNRLMGFKSSIIKKLDSKKIQSMYCVRSRLKKSIIIFFNRSNNIWDRSWKFDWWTKIPINIWKNFNNKLLFEYEIFLIKCATNSLILLQITVKSKTWS